MKNFGFKISAAYLVVFLISCTSTVEEEKAPAQYSIDQFYKNINYGGGKFFCR